MTRVLVHIAATALTLLALSQLNVGIVVDGLYAALVVGIVWGLITLFVRPILAILTLPITLITFGLFSFILNALLFWVLAGILDGFSVAGFIPALLGSVALSLVSSIINRAL